VTNEVSKVPQQLTAPELPENSILNFLYFLNVMWQQKLEAGNNTS
jgi:hypothetical protein